MHSWSRRGAGQRAGYAKDKERGAARREVAAALALSAAAGLVLSYMNGGAVTGALEYALLALPVASASVLLLSAAAAAERRRALERRLLDCLYSIVYRKARDEPLQGTVAMVGATAGGDAGRIFGEASRRMRMGEPFGDALRASGGSAWAGLLCELYYSDHGDDYNCIMRILGAHEALAEERAASAELSMQRYATVNMFVSTILPSFVIFAFIGEAILTQSPASLAAFSIVMVLALPLLYLVGNAVLRRRSLD